MPSAEGFDALVAEHDGRLLRLAYQLTHDRHIAQDVVQEALMQIYRRWDRVAIDSFAAYARRAVVNEFLRRRRLRSTGEIVTDQLPERVDTGHDDALGERDVLWRALGMLPARQRAVLVLRFYEDLPDARIAEIIGARQATVRSLAARGLSAMRAASTAGEWSPA